MPYHKATTVMCTLLVFGLGSPVRADIYSFRDRKGVVHITNMPRKNYRRIVKSRVKKSPLREDHPWRGKKGTARKNRREFNPPRPEGVKGPNPAYDEYVREASRLYHIPANLIRAVIRAESNFNPRALSHAGAMGLMQLMPRTAKRMGVRDPWNPRENILGGTRYLRILANLWNGDLVLTLASYNAGEGTVSRVNGAPNATENYYTRTLRYYYEYQELFPE